MFNSTAAIMVVDKANQDKAVIILLDKAVFSLSRDQDVQKMYPEGAEVIVLQPRLESDPCIHIKIENPQHFRVVSYFPKATSRDAEYLRQRGNEEYKNGVFKGAVELYTKSISMATTVKQRVLGYSNRAQANLCIGKMEKALQDAESAIHLDPSHGKSYSRKARALVLLRQYDEAVKWYEMCLGLTWNDPDTLAAYRQCLVFKSQSLHGTHDISRFIDGGQMAMQVPEFARDEFADYVGHVEIRRRGRGRGVFATRDIKLGELLIVWNATPTRGRYLESQTEAIFGDQDTMTRIFKACENSSRTLAQVYSMTCKLHTVPDMDLFRPNRGLSHGAAVDCDKIDTAWLEEAWSKNHQAIAKSLLVSGNSGLFTLPSFFNNSCLPNVSFLEVGFKTIFVFAAKDIPSGDELLWSYKKGQTLLPGECHDKYFCQRCSLEKRLLEQHDLETFPKSYRQLAEGTGLAVSEDERNEKLADMAYCLEDAMLSSRNLSDVDKEWIRVAYCKAYTAAITIYKVGHPPMPSRLSFATSLQRHASACPVVLCFLEVFKLASKTDDVERLELHRLLMEACRAMYGSRLIDQRPHSVPSIIQYQLHNH